MSAPADRPLSLARLRALPPGARVRDVRDRVWTRNPADRFGRPGWWGRPDPRFGYSAISGADLHRLYRPLHLVYAGEATR